MFSGEKRRDGRSTPMNDIAPKLAPVEVTTATVVTITALTPAWQQGTARPGGRRGIHQGVDSRINRFALKKSVNWRMGEKGLSDTISIIKPQVIGKGERTMVDKFIRGHVKAFTNAIDLGEFTKQPEDRYYAGTYMYMFSASKSDWFKNKHNREYTQVAYR